jgi:hypothetical protein
MENGIAMHTFLKNLTPLRDSNPRASGLEADEVATTPRHHGLLK